ncbi:uncharacterized protein LOC142821259 [Pelodiscus sinensis]|uniref:uncharacterized protein LOC142821259 n=1 Tax=Pelodiscus sinensis TaxID=13735 RepID=UPI003F6BCADD
MRPFLVFFVLLAARSGVLSQVQLVESGPGTVKPAETLSLTCSITGASSDTLGSNCCWWHWVRQSPGKGLEWMGRIAQGGSTNYAASLQSRISISVNPPRNQFSLQLRSLTAADTATYYCARESQWHGAQRARHKKGKRFLSGLEKPDEQGASSQIQLIQSEAEIKKPGESVKAPGEGLEWVGYLYLSGDGSTTYSPAFEGRVAITWDNSVSTAWLQLGSLRADDTASYYCARAQ